MPPIPSMIGTLMLYTWAVWFWLRTRHLPYNFHTVTSEDSLKLPILAFLIFETFRMQEWHLKAITSLYYPTGSIYYMLAIIFSVFIVVKLFHCPLKKIGINWGHKTEYRDVCILAIPLLLLSHFQVCLAPPIPRIYPILLYILVGLGESLFSWAFFSPGYKFVLELE